MRAFMQTSLVGDNTGTIFNDVYFTNADGNFFLDDPSKNTLDRNHPMKEIRVSHGWVVDGISIDYKQANKGTTVTMNHGSQFTNATKVTLGPNETVMGVFGRAGYQTYYKAKMINSIGFMIFDSQKASVRMAGPFGNGNNSNEGDAFTAANIMAFGGFAEDNMNQLGLRGLFFLKETETQ